MLFAGCLLYKFRKLLQVCENASAGHMQPVSYSLPTPDVQYVWFYVVHLVDSTVAAVVMFAGQINYFHTSCNC